jgi:ubiquinone/menaquinone biosynthesis C-methylase UbiE
MNERRESHQEIHRLREVYTSYQEQGLGERLWRDNPGNRAIQAERARLMERMLRGGGFMPLERRKVLEVGCGKGDVLAGFLRWRARPENLHGVDLLEDRISEARQRHPGIDFQSGNAENLEFPDSFFDLVVFFTVFSSILDQGTAANLAAEATRVLRPGGAVLWYDFRYQSPRNPHVRAMTRHHIRRL